MSHIVTFKYRIRDAAAIHAAAKRMNAKVEEGATVDFFSHTGLRGTSLTLPGWHYPVLIKEDGSVLYDNYNGTWGDINQLHKFQSIYGAEVIKRQAMALGYGVEEIWSDDHLDVVVYTT